MMSFQNPAVYQGSKCYATYGVLGHLDPKQPPSKGKPWATLTQQDFVHTATLVIPEEALESIQPVLQGKLAAPIFRRVVMSLHDILSGDFFTEYIKKGHVMMLSKGRRGIDNVLMVKNGVLTMLLDKEAYERAGLVGKPHGVKGKRGLKPRWIVEFDLKGDSMFPGRKGFDRLVYASKNALSKPVTWLFSNLGGHFPIPDPLVQFTPTNCVAKPAISDSIEAKLPELKPPVEFLVPAARDDFETFATEIYEWLSLVRLESPRVNPTDNIDPFLSRYQVPGEQRTNVRVITWEGFLAPSWSRKMLIDIITTLPTNIWFSFGTSTFSKGFIGDNSECTILRPQNSDGEYIMWEVKPHE